MGVVVNREHALISSRKNLGKDGTSSYVGERERHSSEVDIHYYALLLMSNEDIWYLEC